jgi:MFS transporter, MHS family, proline/betaine transporter
MVGQGLAVLVGALLGALITRNLAAETLDSWGWRVPFLLGLVIGPVGLFIRRHLQETEAFLEARGATTVKQSFGTMLAAHVKEVLACMGIITSGTISFYVILLYMPTFARTQLHLPLDQAFVAQSISLACMIVLTPLSGALSDRIGRKPIIIAALTLYFVLVYPLFNWVHDNPSFGSLVIVQIVLCCLLGVFLWSNVDGGCGAVCGPGALDWTWHRLQSGRHDFRRLRAVLRDLVDRGDRLTDSAVVLRDVRRCDWRCGGFFPR